MQWANIGGGGGGFSFGNLSPLQQLFYGDNPNVAFQQLGDYFARSGLSDKSVFGKFLDQQQRPLYNRFLAAQAADPSGGLTLTKFLESQASNMTNQFSALPGYLRNNVPGTFRIRRELW